MPAFPLSLLPEHFVTQSTDDAAVNPLEVVEPNRTLCKCQATRGSHLTHQSSISASSPWIPTVDLRCCPLFRLPGPVCLLSRASCTLRSTVGGTNFANCAGISPTITFNSTDSNSYSKTFSGTSPSSESCDYSVCVPDQFVTYPQVESDIHPLCTVICSASDHGPRAYHPPVTHTGDVLSMVPGTLVFSPTFVSTVSAQPRSSHQFGPVFSQGSQSVHFTQFVQSDRAQYPQSAICPQTDESKSFGLTTSYLPTTTITHRTCSSSDHNYPSTAPHGMSRTNDRHNRYVFSDEELRSQLEQCAITDMSSLPLDRGSSTPASTTGCSSDRPHDELTESLSSSFTQGSVSDIPLSNLEEILARSSIDDVYLGPVEDKYGKLLSLDPTLRVGSETASLPYSSSSLAFSPPGVFMVTEMWPSFMSERLSHCNHRIHCMNLASLRKCLYDHGLNQLGSLAILRRRLQEFVRRIREAQSADASRLRLSHETGDFLTSSDATDQLIEEQPTAWQSSPDKAPNCASMDSNCSRTMKLPKPVVLTPDTFYSYLLIIDLEATCDFQEHRQSAPEYPHEIIEFPILLYNTRTRKCIGVFHAYCKPKLRPDLTAFCTSLTQISQHEVDNAHPFPHVLARIEDWLFNRHGLSNVRCAVVCDCGADMGKFMRIQCRLDGIPLPSWATVWINLSKAFRVFYKLPLRNRVTLSTMLRDLNLSFIGQQHRGLDDAINILRIVRTLLADGCLLRVNERVDFGRAPTYVAAVPRLVAETTSGLMGSRLILLCKKSRLSTGTSSQGDKNDTHSRSTLASDLPEDHIQSLLWLADVQKSRVSKEQ